MKPIKDINALFKLFDDIDLYNTYGIKKLGVFGSFARGESFRDIDLYIEEDVDYQKLIDLKLNLESKTGILFDIMTKENAEPVILHRALKDMKYAGRY